MPGDHLLRSIDRFVDLSGIRQHLADFYSHRGRPSIDPELLIRMLMVGYCFGIRSERRLCEEVHLNLAYRWFCRLDLTDRGPDHSTFSTNRHGRFRESELLRHLFETTVARCIAERLVTGQRMAVDASLIEADANKQFSASNDEWDTERIDMDAASRAVKEYLDTLYEAAFGAATPVKPKFTSYSDPASNEPQRAKVQHSLPILITISSTPITASFAMSRQRGRSDWRKSDRQRPCSTGSRTGSICIPNA